MSEFPADRQAHREDATPPDGTSDRTRWIALLVCCSALFMTLLDVSITNVALPSISDSTGAGPSQLQWIVSGYTLTFAWCPCSPDGSGPTTDASGCSRSGSPDSP